MILMNMTSDNKTFAVRDRVTWTSQVGAYAKHKTGVVVALLPPGRRPDRKQFASLYRGNGCGLSRPELSYVVQVGNRIYWPRAKHLQHAGATS
jgi:hypothetical protein